MRVSTSELHRLSNLLQDFKSLNSLTDNIFRGLIASALTTPIHVALAHVFTYLGTLGVSNTHTTRLQKNLDRQEKIKQLEDEEALNAQGADDDELALAREAQAKLKDISKLLQEGMETCATLGMLTDAQANMLADAT